MLSPSTTTAPANKSARIYAVIKQSLSGETMDYTQGSIRKAVILLAIPMVLEMCMESVFAVVDIFFVSHLGKHATSTVGLTESVIAIIYSLAIGISMAATAMVARRIGEKDPAAATKAGMQAIFLALVITLAVSIPGFIFSAEILKLMGAEDAAIQSGAVYTRIIMGGSIVIMLLFLINGIFRGAGDAMMAMKSLWIANICNIILCPLLIRGLGPVPAFGLQGAAMATTIGRGIGVCYQLYYLFNGKSLIKFTPKHIAPDFAIIKSLISIAWSGTLQFLIGSCSWIVLASLVVQTGRSDASAGYQIGIRVIMFFLLPAWGLSNAAATLVGQNLGAGQPERAVLSVKRTAKYNAVFMGTICILFMVFAGYIASFFTKEVTVAAYAVSTIRIMSAGFLFYGIGMVYLNALNGAGDTRTPTIINFFAYWCFQIPLAYFLAKVMHMGPTGVFIAIPVAETATAIAAYFVFQKGKWKQKKI
jgi:putative MATE family efflux protein